MTTKTLDPVAAAMAAAEAAAAKAREAIPQAPVNLPATMAAPGLPAAPAGKVDLDEMGGGFLSVDGFVNANELGLSVGKTGFHEKLFVGIDLDEVVPVEKLVFNQPVRYFDTVDRVTCRQGGSWAEKLAEAARLSTPQKTIRPFVTADIPMEIIAESKDPKGNVVAAGRRVGFTPPYSSTADFKKVRDEAKRMGVSRVVVELTSTTQMNKASQKYSKVVMKFIGPWEQDEQD